MSTSTINSTRPVTPPQGAEPAPQPLPPGAPVKQPYVDRKGLKRHLPTPKPSPAPRAADTLETRPSKA